mgnify:CR=1 FL=1
MKHVVINPCGLYLVEPPDEDENEREIIVHLTSKAAWAHDFESAEKATAVADSLGSGWSSAEVNA